ncbi:MAG: M20/M25/M40 family metallo-hydrolase [Planctomycetes bacterium]|nr:M20/M25/M40 family metallo-hydrolase [Planctomycetota bacterium]
MKAAATLLLAAGGPLLVAQAPIRDRVRGLLAQVDAARIERDVRTLVGFGTRHVLSRTDSETEGIGAARRWLEAEFAAIAARTDGRLAVARQEATVPCQRPGMPREVAIVNVLATLRGTGDPDRIYVVAGHYDSRNGRGEDGVGAAPGAVDDASGTAAVLEACRVLAGERLPATIVFAAYDGEEQGLLGSRAHAEALSAAGANVDGMITCDIVGNTLGMDGARYHRHVRCFSYAVDGADGPGRSLARAATCAAGAHLPDFEVRLVLRGDRYGRGGDHRSFFERGYPAIRLTEPREDFSRQHQDVVERDGRPYGDLPDYADFAYTANVTRVVVATLAELAAAPPAPLAVSAALRRDRYDTELTFVPAPGAAAHEFVWRETTAADWTHVVDAAAAAVVPLGGGRRQATLAGVCLDDVVVGVRAVGADGSRSRVAVPPEPDRLDRSRRARAAAREDADGAK